MKILKPKQMARWDRITIKEGVSGQTLMKRAAEACLDVLHERSKNLKKLHIVLLCGPGNNGGDAFALAGMLEPVCDQVQCFYWGKFEKYSPEAKYFFAQLKNKPIFLSSPRAKGKLSQKIKKAHWVVDGLFGTGLSRKIMGPCAHMIRVANLSVAKKMAIDMPSGVSGETGESLGQAFKAHVTVTFEVPKWGQLQFPAWDLVGDLEVRPIGLSQNILKKLPTAGHWLTPDLIRKNFHPRKKNMHKGKVGTALILAGSPSMPGAGMLCGLGALRSGVGRAIWGLPQGPKQGAACKIPEIILEYMASGPDGLGPESLGQVQRLFPQVKALALGPGWGTARGTREFLRALLEQHRLPMVLDADALNILSEQPSLLKKLRGSILTPHPKEMGRLLKCSASEVLQNRVALAQKFSRKYGVYLIIKSYRSLAVNPQGKIWINSAGGPNLAVAGSGDVLTGIIVGLLAQGFKPQEAMLAGLYLHGRAGDRLASRMGDRGTLASEIAKEVPRVIRELL